MSEYVNHSHEYAARFSPSAYAKIENPETYFPSLAREIRELEGDLMEQWYLNNVRKPEEDSLVWAGRAQATLQSYREMAEQEILYARFPPEVDEDGRPLSDPETPQE